MMIAPARYFALLSAGLLVLWLGLSWHLNLLLPALGLASALVSAWGGLRLLQMSGFMTRLLPAPARFIPYALWLAREVWRSNITVAKIILAPGKAKPGFLHLPAPEEAPLIALLSTSITLTPGTVTIEADEKGLLVHALVKDAATLAALEEMRRRVQALGGAAAAPDTTRDKV